MASSPFDMDYLAVRERINRKCLSLKSIKPKINSVDEYTIDVLNHPIHMRVYHPDNSSPSPLILLIHGGSWVAGSLETHDHLARYLCKNVNAVVLSVGYTNAPEGKFPLQLEQCHASLLWAKDHAKELNIRSKVAVVGDSAE